MYNPFYTQIVVAEQNKDRLRAVEHDRLVRQVLANRPGWSQKAGNLLWAIARRWPVQIQSNPSFPVTGGRKG